MGKSICCQSETRIGYYNADQRPDLHTLTTQDSKTVIGIMGTYCLKCGKLCDYVSEGIEYYTNGVKK